MRVSKGILIAILALIVAACMFRMQMAPGDIDQAVPASQARPSVVGDDQHAPAAAPPAPPAPVPVTCPTAPNSGSPRETVQLNDDNLCRLYCNCSSADIDRGTVALLHTLNTITAHPYFRYFKVNTEKPCPYWAVSLLCTSAENTCDVCKCSESSIPQSLRVTEDMSDVRVPHGDVDSAHSPDLTSAATSLWDQHWGQGSATLNGDNDEALPYVDLLQNPEGNTGYAGPLAAQVWQAIYRENCMAETTAGKPESECREEAVLKTLLSGLHFSINVQVATNFYKDTEGASPLIPFGFYEHRNVTFFPNCDMYEKRIVPSSQFIENLYVLYQFVLRALAKAKDSYLGDMQKFDANVASDDAALHDALQELFTDELLCRKTFDEELFFNSPRGRELAPQIEKQLLNVTKLMDCVTCEKCRVWGKIQAKGIATAMHIIQRTSLPQKEEAGAALSLDRGELTSLMLLARQLAFSVRSVQQLGSVCADPNRATPPLHL